MTETLAPTPTALPPLPAGVVVPDTAEELVGDDEELEAIVYQRKRLGRKKLIATGRLRRFGSRASGRLEVVANGLAEVIEIVSPPRWASDGGRFIRGPFEVERGDGINLLDYQL